MEHYLQLLGTPPRNKEVSAQLRGSIFPFLLHCNEREPPREAKCSGDGGSLFAKERSLRTFRCKGVFLNNRNTIVVLGSSASAILRMADSAKCIGASADLYKCMDQNQLGSCLASQMCWCWCQCGRWIYMTDVVVYLRIK